MQSYKIFCNFARKMKKIVQIVLFFMVLTSCVSPEKHLQALQKEAEGESALIVDALHVGLRDSVVHLGLENEDILHFVYDARGLCYWSSRSLDISVIPDVDYSGWHEYEFSNATTEVMWSDAGWYQLMTVVVKDWHINGLDEIERSFSYQPIRDYQQRNHSWWQSARDRVRVYYILLISLCVAVLGMAVWMLIAARGFGNLRFRHKIQLLVSLLVLIGFVYQIISVRNFARESYQERQQMQLQRLCRYVQSDLKNLYFFDLNISSFNESGMNIDLRDLAYTYDADIHVYGLDGKLLASSTPELFKSGLLTRLMDPYVYYSNQPTQVRYEHIGSVRYLAAFTEFVNGSDMQLGYIVMPYFISEADIAIEVNRIMAKLFPAFMIVILLTLVLSYIAARAVAQPLQILTKKMQHFALGKDNHLVYKHKDEVGELVLRYNRMVDELEHTTRRLISSEREGAWRLMARQIAHEINNLLTPMKLTIQQLQRVRGTDKFDKLFDQATTTLIEQIDNMSRIATSFSTFAKLPQVETSEVDVAVKLCQIVAFAQNNTNNVPIRYYGPDSGVMAYADKEQIGQVFTNLLKNALQAIDNREDGDVIVILKENEQEVEISISDNGPGIPEDIQPKIFTPNFTTKSNGTGLGLAISKNIVEGSDGKIRFDTSDKGTIFYIVLKKVIL